MREINILVLITDAYGGYGGIAKFNRDFLSALCSHPSVNEVVACPRHVLLPVTERIPNKLKYIVKGVGGKIRYFFIVLKQVIINPHFDLLICGHINLMPLMWLVSKMTNTPMVLIVHGIDAWTPTRSWLTNRLIGTISSFIAVSELTRKRFSDWSGLGLDKSHILPNCVNVSAFCPGPKKSELLMRYGLENKKVLLTLGRISALERYKGFDEIIDALPVLAENIPNIAYLIAGDGDDRPRLEEKVKRLGLAGRVVFAGMVEEVEKVDHYRLADAYVMPSSGEGFGIVFLEAMACGIPVVASKIDGGREAVMNGKLGELADPTNITDIIEKIEKVLKQPRGYIPGELGYFSFENFESRCHQIIEKIV